MAYTIKPSIGMLPVEDMGKVMEAQGFIKKLSADDIHDVTTSINTKTGATDIEGITDPTLIAICSGKRSENGALDRGTVNNAENLNGVPANEYLVTKDKQYISESMENINTVHADEIQLLRSELYHLKEVLIRTGHLEDTDVASGFLDGFKEAKIKYDTRVTAIESIAGSVLTQSEKIFDEGDWIIARKDKTNDQSNIISTVVKSNSNDIQIDSGAAGMTTDSTVLMKTLGEYSRGSYSFSKITHGSLGIKENYTMLNDDSNVSLLAIKQRNTGYAATLKMPNRCAGFLTEFIINGKFTGNPGAITCYVIKGGSDYVNAIASTNGISKAKADGNLVAVSNSVSPTGVIDGEISFNFSSVEYSDSLTTTYPEVTGIEYCFVIEAENVTDYDFWEIEFGHKKNAPMDLETNNTSYKFYDKDKTNISDTSFMVLENIDLLYMAKTRVKKEEDEIPYSVGLYTTLNPIKMSKPIKASRARLTLEVNKEGNFVCSTNSAIKADVDTIEFRKADGSYAEQAVIGGGDSLIVGDSIVNVKTSTPNTITIDKNIYVEPMMPIYRCGYKAQIKTYLIEEDSITGVPSIAQGSERMLPLELVAVIPSGRGINAIVSDRLVFEVVMDEVIGVDNKTLYFNQAELQISWRSFLSSEIIHAQATKGNDYLGRIYSLSVAFDKTV